MQRRRIAPGFLDFCCLCGHFMTFGLLWNICSSVICSRTLTSSCVYDISCICVNMRRVDSCQSTTKAKLIKLHCISIIKVCFESLFVHMHQTRITQGAEISCLDYNGVATLGHAHRIITYLIILWARWGTYPSNGLVRSLPITSRDS